MISYMKKGDNYSVYRTLYNTVLYKEGSNFDDKIVEDITIGITFT